MAFSQLARHGARALITAVLASSSLAVTFSTSAAPALANTSWVESWACPTSITIYAVEDDPALAAPRVVFGPDSAHTREANLVGEVSGPSVPGGKGRQFIYFAETSLVAGGKGIVTAFGQRNESYGSFVVAASCDPLGSVRGISFEDLSANGARDAGEPLMAGAWWKLSGGGNWSICGYTGGDATFGPTVKPGTYILQPIAAPGFRATTQERNVLVRRLGQASLGNDLGFVRDAKSTGDACGQYDPKPTPPASVAPPTPNILGALSTAPNTFNAFLTAVEAAGLTDALNAADITIFAPTDAAFAKLPKATLDRLLANPAQLARILRSHVVPQRLATDALAGDHSLRTLGSFSLRARSKAGIVKINNLAIVGAPLTAANGTIFPIDTVLFTAAK
ncbi:MAG: fasciclin domain-containing protein [Chloroflexi bacterium]|nr:fasciclin domain-containing protein [Chloroflexota bacterium]